MRFRLLFVTLLVALTGCEQAADPAPQLANTDTAVELVADSQRHSVNDHLVQLASDGHLQLLASTEVLAEKVDALLQQPNTQHLDAARQAWHDSYSAFMRVRIFGYLPITDPAEWQRQHTGYPLLLKQLDQWPIEPGYIDYLPGYPYTGIVNDLTLTIDRNSILQQHGLAAPESASVGFHVIEFLLWGLEGERPSSDFETMMPATDAADTSVTDRHPGQRHPDRRRQYLALLASLLHEQIAKLQQRWHHQQGYYARLLTDTSPSAMLSAAMTASWQLLQRELAYLSQSDQRSPYSGYSEAHQTALLQGLSAWLAGTDDDPGLIPLVLEKDTELLQRWQPVLNQLADGNNADNNADNSVSNNAGTDAGTTEAAQANLAMLEQLQTLMRATAKHLNIRLPGA